MGEQNDPSVDAAAADESEGVLVVAAAMDEPEEASAVPATNELEGALVTATRIDEFFSTAAKEKAARYGPGTEVIQAGKC